MTVSREKERMIKRKKKKKEKNKKRTKMMKKELYTNRESILSMCPSYPMHITNC